MHKINGELEYMRECPHCGETQQLSVLHGLPDDFGEVYYAQCDACLSRGPIAGSAKAAVNNWNKRPENRYTSASKPFTEPKIELVPQGEGDISR